MSIWDKSEALGYPRLTDTFEANQPFTLLGMRQSEEIDLNNNLGPTRVNVLTIRGAREDDNHVWHAYGEPRDCGIISGPIAEMAAQATADDFPVVVAWTEVEVKATDRNNARVLRLISRTVRV